MTTPKELKQDKNNREETKKITSRSTEAIKSSKAKFLVDLRSAEGSQGQPKSFQDAPKSTKIDFKITPKRFQDHHRMYNAGLFKHH